MNNDDLVKEAVKLAEKTQSFRTLGDSLVILTGISSIYQAITAARKLAGQLVFGLQDDTPKDVLLKNLKELQGALLGVQLYGVITDTELETYMKMTDKIYNGINKR